MRDVSWCRTVIGLSNKPSDTFTQHLLLSKRFLVPRNDNEGKDSSCQLLVAWVSTRGGVKKRLSNKPSDTFTQHLLLSRRFLVPRNDNEGKDSSCQLLVAWVSTRGGVKKRQSNKQSETFTQHLLLSRRFLVIFSLSNYILFPQHFWLSKFLSCLRQIHIDVVR